MIELTRSGLVRSWDADDLERGRRVFNRDQVLRWSGFLNRELMSLVQERIEQGSFISKRHKDVGLELCLDQDVTISLLHFLTNDPRLLHLVETLTGCGRIGCFMGRVYRMIPGAGHYDSWHDDMTSDRLIGMSINLSTAAYGGGTFQLREKTSARAPREVPNTGFGDAIVFRIADTLEHRVTPVTGAAHKTAFAGWFRSEPEFLSLLTTGKSAQR